MSDKQPAAAVQAGGSRATRETVESIVIAIILAFLFRAFVAEAFVIPTGSMAPTLQGSHKDIHCPECSYQYRASASLENHEGDIPFMARRGPGGPRQRRVVATTCPICAYTLEIDPEDPWHQSFTGDRILVSKFAYELGDPQRWDVAVFKYPGNAKQNYIKRLVGLPNETVRIQHGNIYVRGEDDAGFQIARKPPDKVHAMLQLVDDTQHVAPRLAAAGWPSRWQPWQAGSAAVAGPRRSSAEDRDGMSLESPAGSVRWLRYQHVVPDQPAWIAALAGRTIDADRYQPTLITDYYAYNDFVAAERGFAGHRDRPSMGLHWVGDLAAEFDVRVADGGGELLLKLVQAGADFVVRFDLESGEATLSFAGGRGEFGDDPEATVQYPRAQTRVRGPGRYRLRLANVDHRVLLWVDGRLVEFDAPTGYLQPMNERPVWAPDDPGDLAPVGIGVHGARVDIERAQVFRDVYYIAFRHYFDHSIPADYGLMMLPGGGQRNFSEREVWSIFSDPQSWATTPLFAARRSEQFEMGDDQYFPLGDNSPESRDGRLWGEPPYVDRHLMTGKALLIYWPHALPRPIRYFPNFQRMGLIR